MKIKKDILAGGIVFTMTLTIFWLSPVHQLTDSNFSMLVSQSLLQHRTFALDHYAIPRLPPRYHDNTYKNGEMYQIELVGSHFYYYMPPGSSILSVPYVALFNALGISAANDDGTYNAYGEDLIGTSLAAILMAGLTSIFFVTARLLLPVGWSVLVAMGGALGTQIWSTASRALWSETWGVFLLGLVVLMLLAAETRRRKLNPVWLATLLAWSYFVRPTNSISILAITVYLFIFHRSLFVAYAATGAIWFAGFVAYSWYNFHQLLPNYFLANRLSFNSFGTAFAGNLFSPSRGLLVFVPALLFVAYLLARYRKHLASRPLLLVLLFVMTLHLFIVAGFTPWKGGFCYGPRYTTGLVPWFVLLAVMAITAWRKGSEAAAGVSVLRWKAESAAGLTLLMLSMFMNARGATAEETWIWNVWPSNVDTVPGRVWDWEQPQFLAGLKRPPLPQRFSSIEGWVNLALPEADKFLWYGWSWSEPSIRWSEGREAALVFALTEIKDHALEIRMMPFLVRDKLDEQKIDVVLNGQHLQHLVLKDEDARTYSIALPKSLLKDKNILTFKFADAASPKSLKLSADERRLGIAVDWITLGSL